jgi:hypothetical protein
VGGTLVELHAAAALGLAGAAGLATVAAASYGTRRVTGRAPSTSAPRVEGLELVA